MRKPPTVDDYLLVAVTLHILLRKCSKLVGAKWHDSLFVFRILKSKVFSFIFHFLNFSNRYLYLLYRSNCLILFVPSSVLLAGTRRSLGFSTQRSVLAGVGYGMPSVQMPVFHVLSLAQKNVSSIVVADSRTGLANCQKARWQSGGFLA